MPTAADVIPAVTTLALTAVQIRQEIAVVAQARCAAAAVVIILA